MKRLIYTLSILIISNAIIAQQYFELHMGSSDKLYIEVSVGPGNTLFGMSTATGTSVNEIIKANKKDSKSLSLNELLTLPLIPNKISNTQLGLLQPIRVYYTTKPGDNLYRISKKVGSTSDELIHLNAKPDPSLRLGEQLLIGWINWPYHLNTDHDDVLVHQSTLDNQADKVHPITQRTSVSLGALSQRGSLHPVKSRLETGLADYSPVIPDMSDGAKPSSIVKEKGIAFWQKAAYESKELIVMHRHARVNSKISLYNPMLKRKVDAKVVSELPKEAYSDDISVVISPSVATALGALDRRFLVEITYVE